MSVDKKVKRPVSPSAEESGAFQRAQQWLSSAEGEASIKAALNGARTTITRLRQARRVKEETLRARTNI